LVNYPRANNNPTVKYFELHGNIVDVLNSTIYPGTLKICNGRIVAITREHKHYDTYIIPGFVDAHVHIESAMLTPSEFARIAAVHGTVATISDVHEIANILGIDGIKYMIEDASRVTFKFYFGAPPCVPASAFETAGASIGVKEIEELLKLDRIKCLAEVMNFTAVVDNDPTIMEKLRIAKRYSKPVDGHAPGLRGEPLKKYVRAGISTDHECTTVDEALEKLSLGMKIQIREGSAAKNFDTLISIIDKHYTDCMFCSDDKHPHDLMKGHINELVTRALVYGLDLMKVLRVACVNPVLHYKLDVGLLQVGDPADFLVIDNLRDFNILKTYINGELVAETGNPLIPRVMPTIVNNFNTSKKKPHDFVIPYRGGKLNVIEAIDGQLLTDWLVVPPKVVNGYVVPDVERDILKIAVVNRYKDTTPSVGFVKGFGLKHGAIASSVAHDSHNIVAVGVTDESICKAVNLIIDHKGGICAVSKDIEAILPLPIAGIMSDADYSEVAHRYVELDRIAKSLGSQLHAPFMTLSFMTLPVIPKLKLTDKGLFDVEKHEFINILA